MAGHVYVVEVNCRDGRRLHPAKVTDGSADWERRLDEAVAHFEKLHAGEATVSVHYGRDPARMGVSDPDAVPEWP